MRWTCWLLVYSLPVATFLALSIEAQETKAKTPITWKKTTLDRVFRSEGVAVADVNKDGKMDILNGEFWYEAPEWKPHEIRKPGNYGTGQQSYSNSFACWAEDINKDGYPDLIVIGFPGAPCHWFENPRGQTGHWKAHEIWHSACNETPLYTDLLQPNQRVLVMGFQPKGGKSENMGQMAYFTPGKDPTKTWEMRPISEPSAPGKEIPGTFKFSHGLGVGDVNGDGKKDVISNGGWWQQPDSLDSGAPWKFHPAPFNEAVADMHAVDVNGDGRSDILCSSAHRFGIWAFEQRGGTNGSSVFLKRDLFPQLVSETHAMVAADINGDGLKDFVTGKRWWSHGRAEPGADWPAMLYWFETGKRKDGSLSFTPRAIDSDSGVGTQFTVIDINGDGKLDVAVSNKNGTFIFEQSTKD
ncbi:MAG: FG-GAP repeat domain-containing protein [Gemmataceae bacterium]